jgi:glycosyltransferase involved in cell wall biosynthesis
MGHEVALIATRDGDGSVPEGIRFLAIDNPRPTRWTRIAKLLPAYRLASGWKADVYHAHNVEALLVAMLAGWRHRAKVVFNPAECFHFTAARFSRGLAARVITRSTAQLLRWMSRRAAHVIVVSYTNEAFYRDECGIKKVTILFNSPPPDKFSCENKPPDAIHTITHDGFLSIDRGQNQILDALALLKDELPARFLVVGQVLERDRAAFAERVARLGLTQFVEVTGWLPYAEVGKALNRGMIGLVAMQPTPNNYGSLSNKLFNYMSTGQAVIGPQGSDTERVIRQAHCGITVDMTDPQALATALRALLSDPDRTRQLGRNARRAIEDEFGWHRMEQRLAAIYEDLSRDP